MTTKFIYNVKLHRGVYVRCTSSLPLATSRLTHLFSYIVADASAYVVTLCYVCLGGLLTPSKITFLNGNEFEQKLAVVVVDIFYKALYHRVFLYLCLCLVLI